MICVAATANQKYNAVGRRELRHGDNVGQHWQVLLRFASEVSIRERRGSTQQSQEGIPQLPGGDTGGDKRLSAQAREPQASRGGGLEPGISSTLSTTADPFALVVGPAPTKFSFSELEYLASSILSAFLARCKVPVLRMYDSEPAIAAI